MEKKMSHLIECKNINNKQLLMYYKFEEFPINVNNSVELKNAGPSCLTVDKWLTIKNWIFINDELNKIIKICTSKKIKQTTIEIPNTDFKMSAKWIKISSNVGEILQNFIKTINVTDGQKDDNNDDTDETETIFSKYYLEINVFSSEISALQKFAQDLQIENENLKNALPSSENQIKDCKNTVTGIEIVTDNRDAVEEYIPNKLPDIKPIKDEIKYEPSNLDNKHSQLEYNPTAKPLIGDNTMKLIQYSPSPNKHNEPNECIPIDKTPPNQMIKTRHSYTPTNSKQSTSIVINSSTDGSPTLPKSNETGKAKRHRSKDLFGSESDSFVEENNTEKKKVLTKKKELISPKKQTTPHQPREYLSRESKKDICLKDGDFIDKDHKKINKKTNKKAKTSKGTNNNGCSSSTSSSSSSSKSIMHGWLSKPNKDKLSESPIAPANIPRKVSESYSVDDHKKFTEEMDRKMELLNNIKEQCAKLSIPLPDIKPLNLNHLSHEQIKKSYLDFENTLHSLFEQFCKTQSNKVPQSNVMTSFTQNYLLDDKQQLAMMNVLDDKFGINAADICWKQIMPEWTLALFMRTHDFSNKEEAIKRLDLQEKVIITSKSIMDDSLSISQM